MLHNKKKSGKGIKTAEIDRKCTEMYRNWDMHEA